MTNSNWKVVSSAVVPIVGFVGQDFSRPLPELFIFFPAHASRDAQDR